MFSKNNSQTFSFWNWTGCLIKSACCSARLDQAVHALPPINPPPPPSSPPPAPPVPPPVPRNSYTPSDPPAEFTSQHHTHCHRTGDSCGRIKTIFNTFNTNLISNEDDGAGLRLCVWPAGAKQGCLHRWRRGAVTITLSASPTHPYEVGWRIWLTITIPVAIPNTVDTLRYSVCHTTRRYTTPSPIPLW